MSTDRYTWLVYKKLKGAITAPEAEELSAMLNDDPQSQQEAADIQQAWEASLESEPLIREPDLDASFSKLKDQLDLAPAQPQAIQKTLPRRSAYRWQGIAAVAAIAIGLVFSWTYFRPSTQLEPLTFSTQDKKMKFELPGGNSATLNKNSTLIIQDGATTGNWVMELSGEAMFDIKNTDNKTILIKNRYCVMEVVGTVFNVRCYPKQTTSEVVVKEGQVKVNVFGTEDTAPVLVDANHIYRYTHGEEVSSAVFDRNLNGLAWNRDYLMFYNTPLQEVVSDLETHLGLTIASFPEDLATCTLTGRYDLKKDVTSVIGNIAEVFEMEVDEVNHQQYAFSGGKPCLN